MKYKKHKKYPYFQILDENTPKNTLHPSHLRFNNYTFSLQPNFHGLVDSTPDSTSSTSPSRFLSPPYSSRSPMPRTKNHSYSPSSETRPQQKNIKMRKKWRSAIQRGGAQKLVTSKLEKTNELAGNQ